MKLEENINRIYTKNGSRAVEFFANRLGFLIAQSKLRMKMDSSDTDFSIIDVRHQDVYSEGRIPGAIFVDADDLDSQWHLFSKDKINVLYCYNELCHRATQVCLAASLKGYSVMELHGGFEGWTAYPLAIEK